MEDRLISVCLSGGAEGAEGADLFFGTVARAAGHNVVHWSFKKARTKAPKDQLVVLTEDELIVADPYLDRANKTLGRFVPKDKPWIMNLLRRNYYQINEATSVYAISSFEGGKVKGGTAWATQMFIDRFEGPCACYVFDQENGQWSVWDGYWRPIEAPPSPTGIYAGIGSKALSEAGERAILGMYCSG